MKPARSGILTVMAAALLAACADAPKATQHDVAWLVGATGQAPGSVGRECIDSALRTSYAMVAFQRARSSDTEIQAWSTHNVSLPSLRSQRLHEAEIWAHTHDPAKVSANHLTWCFAQSGMNVADDAILTECLRSTEPAAFLSVARRVGEPQTRAVQAMIAFYAARAASEHSGSLADAVYGAPTDDDDLKLRVGLFSSCVARSLQ